MNIIFLVSFLLPLFFLPFTSDLFLLPKLLLLTVAVLYLSAVWLLNLLQSTQTTIRIHFIQLGLFIFLLSQIFSLVLFPNPVSGLVTEVYPIFLLNVYFFLSLNIFVHLPKASVGKLPLALVGSTTLLAFIALAEETFPGNFPANFTPAGSYLVLTGLLAISSLMIIFQLPEILLLQQNIHKYIILPLTTVLLVLHISIFGLVLYKSSLNPLTHTPFAASWHVALNVLRELPLTGYGPGNYIDAYNRYRPKSTNSDSLWTVRFTTAHNSLLHFATTGGLPSLIGYLVLLFTILAYLTIRISTSPRFIYICFLVLGISFFIPNNLTINFFLVHFLAILVSQSPQSKFTLVLNVRSPLPLFSRFRLVSLLLIAFIFLSFFSFRVLASDIHYAKGLGLLKSGQSLASTIFFSQSIHLNPFSAQHHIALSKSSLLSVTALPDTSRDTASNLLTQSVLEAEAAVHIAPLSSQSWLNLFQVYYQLIPLSREDQNKTAQQLTLSVLAQTIKLDPLNPEYYALLGNFHSQFGRFSKARDAYLKAISLKPEFGHAFYKLGLVFKNLGDTEKAKLALEKAIELTPPDSPDLASLEAELDTLFTDAPSAPPTATPFFPGISIDAPMLPLPFTQPTPPLL